MEVLTVLFCTTDYVDSHQPELGSPLHCTEPSDYSLPDMNFSYKASLNFPLYPQLFNCHHESSRFNAGRQSSSLLMQRLMALHKEVQTHELSTGLSFFQSLLPRAVCEAGTHTHTHKHIHPWPEQSLTPRG